MVQYLEVMDLLLDLLVGSHRQVQVGLILFGGAAGSQIVIQILVAAALVEGPSWRKHVGSLSTLRILKAQELVLLAALPLDFLAISLHERLGQVNGLIV